MESMAFLILANLAFLAGPIVLKFLGHNRRMGMFLDGLTYAAILTFCFFHVLPEVIHFEAYYMLAIFALGLWFPLCPQYFQKKFGINSENRISLGIWVIIVFGVAVHVFAEGAVLATQQALSQIDFGLSVIIHRFGIGVVILNFFLKHGRGKDYGYTALALLMLGTTLGYFFGGSLGTHSESHYMLYVEVFIAGNLLHFINHANVFDSDHYATCGYDHDHHEHDHDHQHQENDQKHAHHHEHEHDHDHAHHNHHPNHDQKGLIGQLFSEASFSSYGALAVVALLILELLNFGDAETKTQFFALAKTFFHLFSESAFPLLSAFLFAGLFKALIRPAHLTWLEKGGKITQTSKGIIFGMPLPICSCGVLPLYQSLIKKGVPVSAAVAFLIATPEIGFDAIFLSFALLGENFTIVRLLGATVLAIVVALIFGYMFKKQKSKLIDADIENKLSLKQRLRDGMRYGFVDLVDHTIPWIFVGLILASLMDQFISYEVFQSFSSVQQVFIMALIGVPLYVCASGATPLAAILLHKGVSAGAVIAFLLAGPATNISTFGILKNLHGKKFALLFGTAVFTVAILLGLGIDLIDLPVDKIVHSELGEPPSTFKWIGATILGLLIMTSFIRQGLRHFIEQLSGSSHSH